MQQLAIDTEQATKVRVFDLETTGLPEDENAEIIEWGYIDLALSSLEFCWFERSFIKPVNPVTPKTMAIHHITNDDLVEAPTYGAGIVGLSAGMSEHDVWCAHNITMERHFFPGGDRRWICTYKVAMSLWPEFESHSNQACRYTLNLKLDKNFAEPPHRALPDAYVTAHILREALKLKTVAELVEITATPVLLKTIGFGKHRGKTFEELARTESGYLRWMLGQEFDEDTLFTVKHWLGVK